VGHAFFEPGHLGHTVPEKQPVRETDQVFVLVRDRPQVLGRRRFDVELAIPHTGGIGGEQVHDLRVVGGPGRHGRRIVEVARIEEPGDESNRLLETVHHR
jgi:hypothetical protein